MTAERDVRSLHDDELATFLDIGRTAMLMAPPGEAMVEARRPLVQLDRCHVAVDGGQLVGSARAFACDLAVPGERSVPAAGVTSVGVLPTHRRRGHLTRLMHAQLADVARRGEVVAVLLSADWPIYGRYGYGVATEAATVSIDSTTAAFRRPATGRIALVDTKSYGDAFADVHARACRTRTGHMTQSPGWLDALTGVSDIHDGYYDKRRDARKVVWYDDTGTLQGAAAYTVTEQWVDNRPRGTLDVETIAATTDEAERELYRFFAEVDWAGTVTVGPRPVDDPLSLHLVDGRAARLTDRFDFLWARVVDVPGALAGRRYAHDDAMTLRVLDPGGLGDGTFALEGGPDGATCTPTDRSPDLTVTIDVLGSAYLGGYTWARLAAAGLVTEERPGAVARAGAWWATDRAPHCPIEF